MQMSATQIIHHVLQSFAIDQEKPEKKEKKFHPQLYPRFFFTAYSGQSHRNTGQRPQGETGKTA